MLRKITGFVAVLVLFAGLNSTAQAQFNNYYQYQLQRWYYYPYYYFPHNYWPTMGPRYPERPWEPYRPRPAYMVYPPFLEPNWRYELWQFQRYYRGFHFWLDQF